MRPDFEDSTKRLFRGRFRLPIAGGRDISDGTEIGTRAGQGALLLLFARGERPDALAVREAVAGSSRLQLTELLDRDSESGAARGLEILCEGMTFDVVGLAPGAAIPLSAVDHRIAMPEAFDIENLEAIALQPGPHIAAGARTMPVMRTLMATAIEIVPHLAGLAAISWPPAATLVGADFFLSTGRAWTEGGAFPALGLTAFAPADDGGLLSEGLAWFTGQEIAVDPSLAEDRAAATQLAVRLVNQLVGRGRLGSVEQVIGPSGEILTLEPQGDTIAVHRR